MLFFGLSVLVLDGDLMGARLRKAAISVPIHLERRVVRAASVVERFWKQDAMKGSRTRAKRKGRAVTAADDTLGVDIGRLKGSITTDIQQRFTGTTADVGPQRAPYAERWLTDPSRFPASTAESVLDETESEITRILEGVAGDVARDFS